MTSYFARGVSQRACIFLYSNILTNKIFASTTRGCILTHGNHLAYSGILYCAYKEAVKQDRHIQKFQYCQFVFWLIIAFKFIKIKTQNLHFRVIVIDFDLENNDGSWFEHRNNNQQIQLLKFKIISKLL